jgi:hypothetical protein
MACRSDGVLHATQSIHHRHFATVPTAPPLIKLTRFSSVAAGA